ncbi:sensor histidine kinase [Kitasatospora sp. NPDC059571]|uniref:sensor histidine kinase n=1 Tax=Kitasatospora sp. NPDC059571 TaxID=3346871 RepID=UPI00367A3F09
MVRAGSPPGSERLATAALWLLPPAVLVAFGAAAYAASAGTRSAILWCGAAATAVVALTVAEADRRGRAAARSRAEAATFQQRFAALDADWQRRLVDHEAGTARLADVLLPEAINRLQTGGTSDEVLRGTDRQTELHPAHRRVLYAVVDAVQAEEDLRDSAQRSFVNIARRVQAIVHQQAQDLRQMQDRHGRDPEVFGDLLHLDHGTALIGRLADSIAVLGGARPGRQWHRPVTMFSVLRGAMSRIVDYQRVDLHSVAEVAVVGPAVEPLIHALAELLDNATRYSPPHTRVHLTAIEIPSGIAVEIEDSGVGLSEEARRRAERVLSDAPTGLDLADLGEAPRLGLSVVGRLAQANDFRVSLRPSAYAGVRAVLVVPSDLITAAPAPATPSQGTTVPAPRRMTGPQPMMAGEPLDEPADVERNAHGLPQRRRRTLAAPAPARTTARVAPLAPAPVAPAAPAVEPGLWMGAFQSAVSGESTAGVDARSAGDDSSDKGE